MKGGWKKYLTVISIGIVIAAVIALARDVFHAEGAASVMRALSDAFFIPGVLFVGCGLLVFCDNGGTFDMLSYGTKTLFSVFMKDERRKERETFYEYRQRKLEKKRSWTFLVYSGLFFIALSILFLVLYYNL